MHDEKGKGRLSSVNDELVCIKSIVLQFLSFQKISFRFLETLHMELLLSNWIFIRNVQDTKQLTDHHEERVRVLTILGLYNESGDDWLDRIVTGDET